MAKKPNLSSIGNILNSSAIINANWVNIQTSFDNTLSRDGSTPNQMEADIDLNSNDLLNVGSLNVSSIILSGQNVTGLVTVPDWKGSWTTATSYVLNDLVRQDGNTYICLVAHTSGTFSTDLTALKWELFAQKGSAGVGTGDMLASNNLSDVADVPTSRANLGLGTVAVENTVPVAKGGTGSTTASEARTNLGLGDAAVGDIGVDVQAYDADLETIAGISRARGDLIVGGVSNWQKLAIGTSGKVLTSDGTDVSWEEPSSNGVSAWVNFNGVGTVAIRASNNISSITDNGVGDWSCNFTTPMADVNYAAVVSGFGSAGDTRYCNIRAHDVNFVRVGQAGDISIVSVAVFR